MRNLNDTGCKPVPRAIGFWGGMTTVVFALLFAHGAWAAIYPGPQWETRTPAAVGLDGAKLDAIQAYMGGRGCLVRYGCLVYYWGNYTARGDVASAAKPWYSTLLFQAVEEGRLASLDTLAIDYEPRLSTLNASLGFKDTNITFRHFANQISCYGVQESPGTAYDYNDWQMALFWDTLFLKVYGATQGNVDATVLHPKLTDILQCQDNPTFMAFGTGDRPGRLAVSPRDFARFGLLYLHRGNWNGTQVLSESHATMAVTSPLSLAIPRTAGVAAEMIPGQRTIGSSIVPDNQTDHDGGYSWLWWINGIRRNGQRRWPEAPPDVFACLGHSNKRGLAVLPSQGIVLSWNDTTLDTRPDDPHPLSPVFQLLLEGITNSNRAPVVNAGPDQATGTNTLSLAGALSDDGLPSGSVDVVWTQVSGPGSVTFGDSNAVNTIAHFSVPGTYLLRLSADDGDLSASDEVQVSYIEPGPMAGQIIVDPDHPNRMVYRETFENGRLKPCFFAGPGDPEDFFYNNTAANLELLRSRGARCTYITAYLGDFGGGQPGSGTALETTLNAWENYITELENAGIITVFFFFDDSVPLPSGWEAAVDQIVNKFEHHKLLIWSVAEEYAERLSPAQVSSVADRIKAADDHDHIIGVHQNSGTRFDFNGDPDLNLFLIQYNVTDADSVHRGLTSAWTNTSGQKILNLAEIEDHAHQDRVTVRRWNWAAALGGASAVQVLWMGRASDDPAWNDPGKYNDCALLMDFMEGATLLNTLSPHDDLAHGATQWVLANPGTAYLAYATNPGDMGLRGMTAGSYNFRWLDIPSGTIIQQSSVAVAAGDQTWTRPPGIGSEAAVYLVNRNATSGPNLEVGQVPGQVVDPGSNVVFTVAAQGAGALRFQWLFNGQPIPGATNAVLSIPNAQLDDEGFYAVTVADESASLTSEPAWLQVRVPPTFLFPPQSQTVTEGSTLVLHAGVFGSQPMGFRWRFNGATLVPFGQRQPTLVLTNVQMNQAGRYELVATNVATTTNGVISRPPATVTVLADNDRDGMADDWETANSFSVTDPLDAEMDADGDRMTNRGEFLAGTDPRDAASHLRVRLTTQTPGADAGDLEFLAVSNKTYTVQCSATPTGPWLNRTNVLTAASNRVLTMPLPFDRPSRYSRLVTPLEP